MLDSTLLSVVTESVKAGFVKIIVEVIISIEVDMLV